MASITTISQLGARLSLAKLHVRLLTDAARDQGVQHIFYIVDSDNRKLMEYGEELSDGAQVRSKLTNDYTRFGVVRYPAFGGDFNYDYLLRDCEIGDYFLTLHDDTLIYSNRVFSMVRDSLSTNDFGGFLDQRAKDAYSKIFLDGKQLGDLRIGTWFLFGRTEVYRKFGYKLAAYKNYYKWLINIQFRTLRLSTSAFRVWLNGGFDLNIRARVDGKLFDVLDNRCSHCLGRDIEHFEKITGFFAHRGMMRFVDTVGEVDQWRKWFKEHGEANGPECYEISFMSELAMLFERYDIFDPLLNRETISDLAKVS